MKTADLAKVESLITVLRNAGFDEAAYQLNEAMHETRYPDPVEMFGEIVIAVRAAAHMVGPFPSDEIASALSCAKEELAKISPDYRF